MLQSFVRSFVRSLLTQRFRAWRGSAVLWALLLGLSALLSAAIVRLFRGW